jgi:phosphoglycolate phosphatase
MKLQAICFDLDGTLLNTLEDLAHATNTVLQAQRLPTHPVEAYNQFVGEGAARLIEKVLPAELRTPERQVALLDAFHAEYSKCWNQRTTLYDGVAELLDQLAEWQVPITVLSNKPDAFTQECVSEFLGKWPWAVVFGQREGIARKPDPVGVYEIAKQLGVEPSEMCFVGDTSIDMQTACNAGCLPMGVTWGFRDAAELREHGAQHLIDHPSELVTWWSHRNHL